MKFSQNFYQISLKILVNLTDFSPQVMACMQKQSTLVTPILQIYSHRLTHWFIMKFQHAYSFHVHPDKLTVLITSFFLNSISSIENIEGKGSGLLGAFFLLFRGCHHIGIRNNMALND